MKIKNIILILPILMLFGCSTKSISETFENTSSNEKSKIKIIAEHKGNKIEKLKYEIVTPFSKLLVSSKEEAKEVMEDVLKSYNSVEGVTAKVEYVDNTVIQKIEIDEKNELSNHPNNNIGENINFNNFNDYKNTLLKNGFEKK